jgi:putative protease
MKLLVPVNSMESAEMEIRNGADELYAGLSADWSNRISFAARGNFKRDGKPMIFNFEELKDLSELCRKNKVGLDITLNNVHITGFLRDDVKEQIRFLKYVEKVLEYPVNSLIISDVAAIRMVRRAFPDVHITSSSELEINNVAAVNFLEELGTSRVVLTYQITLDEIAYICKNTSVEIEVFGHRGCSFHPGYCMFKHVVGEHGDNGINVGTPCRNYYTCSNTEPEKKEQYLDASLMCSICSIPELVKINPSVLKLAGREMQTTGSTGITGYYRRAIDMAKSGETTVQNIRDTLPVWWKKTLCREKRCKHINTSTSESFTGTRDFHVVKVQDNDLKPVCNHYTQPSYEGRIDEVRVHNNAVFEKALLLGAENIGIGHEYCSTFLRNTLTAKKYLEKIIDSGKHPVIITPNVHAEELDILQAVLEDLTGTYKDMDIVFNDWGLLKTASSCCRKTEKSNWWIGRLLSRSMADWPWFKMVVREEDEDVKQAFLCNYLNNDEMYTLLSSYLIDGVEFNNNILNHQNCEMLKNNGFKVKVHYDRKLLAVGRACIYLSNKLGQKSLEGCDGNCGLLELDLKALDSTDELYLNNAQIKDYYPDLLVAGTGIFEKNAQSKLEIPAEAVDRICVTLF